MGGVKNTVGCSARYAANPTKADATTLSDVGEGRRKIHGRQTQRR
jgi:hypothetical protein